MAYSRIQQRANLNAIRAKTLQLALYSSNPTALDVGNEITGGAPRLIVIMGIVQHNTLAEAQVELVPITRPAFMQGISVLIGRVIANNGVSTVNTATPFISYVFQ